MRVAANGAWQLLDSQSLPGRVAGPRNQTNQRLAFAQVIFVLGLGNAR